MLIIEIYFIYFNAKSNGGNSQTLINALLYSSIILFESLKNINLRYYDLNNERPEKIIELNWINIY
jgi:hypothetical protein